MTRLPNWEIRLQRVIDEFRQVPFEWGKHDCGLFAARVLLEITGQDALNPYKGRYKTEQEAMNMVMQEFGSLEALACHHLGEPIAPLKACRGDIVLGRFFDAAQERRVDPEAENFAVCIGRRCITAGTRELLQWPLSKGRIAWHG